MVDIESPLYQSCEDKIYKYEVRPHKLASIGGNKTVFLSMDGTKIFYKKGPRRFPTADLGELIEDVRRKKILDSVTMPRQWNHKENIDTWGIHQGKSQGGNMQGNGVYLGKVLRPTSLDPYSTQARKGIKNLQGKGWQIQNQEHRHPVLVKFMAKFLQKYSSPYFEKVLVARNKTTKGLPKYGGNLHGKRDMCMHHIWKNAETQISSFIMQRSLLPCKFPPYSGKFSAYQR